MEYAIGGAVARFLASAVTVSEATADFDGIS
jgi:hypothetical protein